MLLTVTANSLHDDCISCLGGADGREAKNRTVNDSGDHYSTTDHAVRDLRDRIVERAAPHSLTLFG